MGALGETRAERDWEYWSRYSLSAPLYSNIVTLVVKPEWRMRGDMADTYLIKPEFGVVLRVTSLIDITPHYVWQKSRTPGGWDYSDLSYLDATLKVPLSADGKLKLIERLRHEYNWDKATTTWRNALRLGQPLKLGAWTVAPFVEDEVFYSEESDRWNRNWASAGAALAVGKQVDVVLSYLLDAKRTEDDWTYANVLVTSFAARF
jgi:hypothetical protein